MIRVRRERTDIGKTHNYPLQRKERECIVKTDGSRYIGIKKRKMQDMIIKLMGYAPAHCFIYTMTYNKTQASRYQYTDVFCVNNGRLFKITKIVAYIMGYKMHVMEGKYARPIFWSEDCMRLRTYKENQVLKKKDMVENEINLVKSLSMKLFNNEDGYNHESLLTMNSQFSKPIEEINHPKKSYIVRSI